MLSRQTNQTDMTKLIAKYGGSVPRYTSYPTAPEWKDSYSQDSFEAAIHDSNLSAKDFSLYLHIPFCESQCYYCGCNVVISKEHGIEEKYLDQLKYELDYYSKLIDKDRKVIQMAWGGGTPTFLAPEQILDLMKFIKQRFSFYKRDDQVDHEYAIEIDPRVTSYEHLEALWSAGFNRLSLGIQDFNLDTQVAINRVQSYEMVNDLVSKARKIGFTSINFDLIYGLPHQSLESFASTISQVIELNPDRIAFFNYAHIPQIFPFQKKYIDEQSLPDKDTKTKIFDNAVQAFTGAGYEFIGLDHFAKSDDTLSIAQKNKTLYRNFQGYTTHSGADLFGFGITAISDVQGVYKQNFKKLNDYYSNIFGADKFKASSSDDKIRRQIIKELMCNGQVSIVTKDFEEEIKALEEMQNDYLIVISSDIDVTKISVTDLGRVFVRNIASKFDVYLKKEAGHKLFSTSI
jgi:oxygen-independent coproporphyrinogen III oxidase